MFAEAEEKLVARLRAILPAEVHVGTLDELEDVNDMRQKAPACWVIYDGHTIGKRIDSVPNVAQVVQEWFVVIATKSAKSKGGNAEAKREASGLCTKVLEGLAGFDLGAGKYLRVEDAPGPEYSAGYVHVPLAFSSAATFKGKP